MPIAARRKFHNIQATETAADSPMRHATCRLRTLRGSRKAFEVALELQVPRATDRR